MIFHLEGLHNSAWVALNCVCCAALQFESRALVPPVAKSALGRIEIREFMKNFTLWIQTRQFKDDFSTPPLRQRDEATSDAISLLPSSACNPNVLVSNQTIDAQ